MSSKLPYSSAPGQISKLISKISEARIPDRFTIDFLGTKLGLTGGAARPFIPLLKRLGFLGSDGTPTELYTSLRDESTRGYAMAEALRNGFSELFDRNEYAGELERRKLALLVNQITGAEKDNRVDQLIVSTFLNLSEFADFEASSAAFGSKYEQAEPSLESTNEVFPQVTPQNSKPSDNPNGGVGMNLSYTINLNLPESTDPKVFNAIFKSLRENLLK